MSFFVSGRRHRNQGASQAGRANSLTGCIDRADKRFRTLSPFLKLFFVYDDKATNGTMSTHALRAGLRYGLLWVAVHANAHR